jgi:RNA polymerase sigma factor (sigma-70 family)
MRELSDIDRAVIEFQTIGSFKSLMRHLKPWCASIIGAVGSKYPCQFKDDLQSELNIEIWRRAQTFDPTNGAEFLTYLSGHIVAAMHEKMYRQSKIVYSPYTKGETGIQTVSGHDDDDGDICDQIPADGASLADSTLLSQVTESMGSILDDTDRQVVEMLHIDDLCISEIATRLGKSRSWTLNRYNAAIAKLRAALG